MIEMTHTVKMADLSARIAAGVFAQLNPEQVVLFNRDPFWEGTCGPALITGTDPEGLVYPEGWYFAKGCFRNKHNTNNGYYEEVPIYRFGGRGERW